MRKSFANFAVFLVLVGLQAFLMPLLAQEITVNGGNQTTSITSGTPGGEPVAVVNTATTLTYRKQSVIAKITVGTSCPGQSFTLKVLAVSPTKGVAAPEVTLTNGMPAADFITSIPKTGAATGTCTLQYTASALFSQGNSLDEGNDVHTVTYTILAQ